MSLFDSLFLKAPRGTMLNLILNVWRSPDLGCELVQAKVRSVPASPPLASRAKIRRDRQPRSLRRQGSPRSCGHLSSGTGIEIFWREAAVGSGLRLNFRPRPCLSWWTAESRSVADIRVKVASSFVQSIRDVRIDMMAFFARDGCLLAGH